MSGVAYSLLFSSFESWAISEADRLRLDRRYLIQLFSSATFFNAMSAGAYTRPPFSSSSALSSGPGVHVGIFKGFFFRGVRGYSAMTGGVWGKKRLRLS